MFDLIATTGFAVFAFWSGVRAPGRFLFWSPLIISVDVFLVVGVVWTPAKLCAYLFLAGWVLGGRRVSLSSGGLALVAITMLAASFGSAIYLVTETVSNAAIVRLIVQVVSYTNVLAWAVSVWVCAKSERTPWKLLSHGILFACSIHLVYGLYQSIAFQVGLPFRGPQYGYGVEQIPTIFGVFRINGFADEPKRLSILLLMGLAIALHSRERPFARVVSLVAGLLLTMSTSALSVLAVWLPGHLLAKLKPSKALILVLVSGFGVFLMSRSETVRDVFSARTISAYQLALSDDTERVELSLLRYWGDNPVSLLTGMGPGLYSYNLGPGVGYGSSGMLRPVNSLLFRLLADLGPFGLIALTYPVVVAINCPRRSLASVLWVCLLTAVFLDTLLYLVVLTACGQVINLRSQTDQDSVSGA